MKSTSHPLPRNACRLPAAAPMVAKNSIIRAPPRASAPANGAAAGAAWLACPLLPPLLLLAAPLLRRRRAASRAPSAARPDASTAMNASPRLGMPTAVASWVPSVQARAAAAMDKAMLSAVTAGLCVLLPPLLPLPLLGPSAGMDIMAAM